jgi:hypothetical protein
MQISAQPPPSTSSGSGSRFKKKPDREEWKEEQQMMDKRAMMAGKNGTFEESPRKGGGQQPVPSPEKNMSVRKAMAMKEPPPKRPDSPKKPKLMPPVPQIKPLVNPGQVVLDKFGNFRLMTPPELKKGREGDMPPLPPGAPPKGPVAGRAQSFDGWLKLLFVNAVGSFFFLFNSCWLIYHRHVAWLLLSS